MVLHIKGLWEKFKNTCTSLGIQVHFKGNNTIRTLFMAPKDEDNKYQKSGVIYRFKCPWLKETLRDPFLIHHHSHTVGHPVNPKCFTIVDRESQEVTGNIKEAIYIHVYYPSLNRNLGKYQLPHIWDEVLQDTPSLQLS